MENGDLRSKYGNKGRNEAEFLHSSGYARVQSGGRMGAASAQSFAERQALEKKRKLVQKYSYSDLVRGALSARKEQRPKTKPDEAGGSAKRQRGAEGAKRQWSAKEARGGTQKRVGEPKMGAGIKTATAESLKRAANAPRSGLTRGFGR